MPRALTLLAVLSVASVARRDAAAGVEREIAVDGVTRSYLIHVPKAWDRVRPIPVLLVFHGAGSDAESMVSATGFDAMAEAAPMLVVYPRAPARTKRYDVDPPAGRTSADVRFVDALLARLRERFPVDGRRVWATGFSNGAALCYRLAAERSAAFAAVAPVAGYVPRTVVRAPPVEPVPVLHVHGTADGRVRAPSLRADVDAAIAAWALGNGCAEAPTTTVTRAADGLVMRRAAYAGPTARSDTHLLLVEGQGHVWAGGPGGSVSREVLAFLAAHPRAEPATGSAR